MTSRPEEHAIRLATAADAPAARALVRAAYGIYVARMGQEPGPMVDDYAAQIAAGRVHLLELEGRLAGVLVLIDEADALLLDNVAVDPARQGQGWGGVLLGFAEEQARARGYGAIRLYTHESMVENVALYKRFGYAITGQGTEKGFARVYMRKEI